MKMSALLRQAIYQSMQNRFISDAATNNEPHFRLFDLPADIRNRIYNLLIPQDDIYNVLGVSRQGGHIPPPALCRASHQLRAETLPIWRGNNAFTHGDEDLRGSDPRKWIMELARSGLQHINVLEIEQLLEVNHVTEGRNALSISLVAMKTYYVASITWKAGGGNEMLASVMEEMATKKIEKWVRLIGLMTNRKMEALVIEVDESDEEEDE